MKKVQAIAQMTMARERVAVLEAEIKRLRELHAAERAKVAHLLAKLAEADDQFMRQQQVIGRVCSERDAALAAAKASEECRHGGRQRGETPCPDCAAKASEEKP